MKKMDDEVFLPTEESIKEIVQSKVLHNMATAKLLVGNHKVSLVGKKPGSKCSGKECQSRPVN